VRVLSSLGQDFEVLRPRFALVVLLSFSRLLPSLSFRSLCDF
jgi:hypothetical protein